LEKSVPDEIRSGITFALNNLTVNNIEDKANEIKNLLSNNENGHKWFARVIV
jgi:hypothetical protein